MSKLEILGTFHVATPDLLLAEQIEEAMKSETSAQFKIIDEPVQMAETKVSCIDCGRDTLAMEDALLK